MLYNESIEPITLRERLPVTKTAGKIVVSQIQKFLEHEVALDEEGKGELSEDEVEYFEDLIREFNNRDLFTLTLNGLDDAINSYASEVPTRAGLVKITQMELIDAYGQVRRIDPEGLTLEKDGELPQINVGLSVQNPADDPGLLVLRPRLLILHDWISVFSQTTMIRFLRQAVTVNQMNWRPTRQFVASCFQIILNGRWKSLMLKERLVANFE